MKVIVTAIVMCFGVWSASAALAAEPETVKSDATAKDGGDGASPNDTWRFKFYQGRWWYWLPTNYWAVYENGRWLMPVGGIAAARAKPSSSATTAAAAKNAEGGTFAEDYPAAPVGPEEARQSTEYYMSVGSAFNRHAHEHAQILERFAASGETVPAKIVKEQAAAIHHDVEQAQKSFSRLATSDDNDEDEDLPVAAAIKKLQGGLRKVSESLQRLEGQVQQQTAVQAELVRGQTAIISDLLTQANAAAEAAEEEQRKYEQNQKDLAGVD